MPTCSNPDFAEARNNRAILFIQPVERALALEQFTLLKALDYELAQKLSTWERGEQQEIC
jgi:hypothetical protein